MIQHLFEKFLQVLPLLLVFIFLYAGFVIRIRRDRLKDRELAERTEKASALTGRRRRNRRRKATNS